MIMAHPKFVGRENLRDVDGPLLISCNHVTYIDVGFALLALPPRLRRKLAVGMWGELLWEMWRPPAAWNSFMRLSYKVGYYLVVALFNVFPLPQQSGVRESFAYAGESVDRGYSVLVYPEGVRTPDGKPSPFRSGLGMLAARLNIPVLPLANRRPLRDEAGRPQDRASRAAEGRHRQTHALPAGNPAGGNHQPARTRHLDDVEGPRLFPEGGIPPVNERVNVGYPPPPCIPKILKQITLDASYVAKY